MAQLAGPAATTCWSLLSRPAGISHPESCRPLCSQVCCSHGERILGKSLWSLCHRTATALPCKRPVFFRVSLLQTQVMTSSLCAPRQLCSPMLPQAQGCPQVRLLRHRVSSLSSPWQFSFLPHHTHPSSSLLPLTEDASCQSSDSLPPHLYPWPSIPAS